MPLRRPVHRLVELLLPILLLIAPLFGIGVVLLATSNVLTVAAAAAVAAGGSRGGGSNAADLQSSFSSSAAYHGSSSHDDFSSSHDDSLTTTTHGHTPHPIPARLFHELEELARLVDIAYCVGGTGVHHPFACVSRCHDFPTVELVETFNTGPLLSDSCGYVAVQHASPASSSSSSGRRILVAFRGTYSLANTIADLSTRPQEYVPYAPGGDDDDDDEAAESAHEGIGSSWSWAGLGAWNRGTAAERSPSTVPPKQVRKHRCENCTVHSGFWRSWQNTRGIILDYVTLLRYRYPDYTIHLVGHSLGGAVAALAGLEMESYGWDPVVTTFGEPKIGNVGLQRFLDARFHLDQQHIESAETGGDIEGRSRRRSRFRRVTHAGDPVPLLPWKEWDYATHAGEIHISKRTLQPDVADVVFCRGDADDQCIARGEADAQALAQADMSWMDDEETLMTGDDGFGAKHDALSPEANGEPRSDQAGLSLPAKYRVWEVFFAHRDYFWRLGLCVPGGDPLNWGRHSYGHVGDVDEADDDDDDDEQSSEHVDL